MTGDFVNNISYTEQLQRSDKKVTFPGIFNNVQQWML